MDVHFDTHQLVVNMNRCRYINMQTIVCQAESLKDCSYSWWGRNKYKTYLCTTSWKKMLL